MSRYIVISDIHGRFHELDYLLKKYDSHIQNGYKLVLLGDYVGYGNMNSEVVKKLIHLSENDRVIILKGSWEDIIYRAYRPESIHEADKHKKLIINKGSYLPLFELVNDKKLLEEFLDLIENMKPYHIDGRYLFAHSGVDFRIWERCSSFEMFMLHHSESHYIWNDEFYENYLRMYFMNPTFLETFRYTVVSGHVPTYTINPAIRNFKEPNPFVWGKVIGVNFGAFSKEGRLGAVAIDENISFSSVKVGFMDSG